MSNGTRIGVYGGTFDPIHTAHLAIARAALDQAGLDSVLFVVAARPPHKHGNTYADAEDRYAMVQAALAEEPKFEPSHIELDRDGPSYTADTLRQLNRQLPDAQLFLILGMDSLVELPSWRSPETILELAKLLVVDRPGTWEVPALLENRFEMLAFDSVDVSSTEIRQRIADGTGVDDCVPPDVLDIIHARGLYRAD